MPESLCFQHVPGWCDAAVLETKFWKPVAYKKQETAWLTEEEEFGAGGREIRRKGEKREAKEMVEARVLCDAILQTPLKSFQI